MQSCVLIFVVEVHVGFVVQEDANAFDRALDASFYQWGSVELFWSEKVRL